MSCSAGGEALTDTMRDPLTVGSREAWREWLEENHSEASVVWLVIRKKGSDAVAVYLRDAVEEAVCYGWIDGKIRGVDEKRYVLRISPRQQRSVWSRSNRERAERLMGEGRMAPAGHAAVKRARADGTWAGAYAARSVAEMPEDLKGKLAECPEAARNFARFTDNQQATYVAWVLDAKRSETRARRIRQVVERAGCNIKPGIV